MGHVSRTLWRIGTTPTPGVTDALNAATAGLPKNEARVVRLVLVAFMIIMFAFGIYWGTRQTDSSMDEGYRKCLPDHGEYMCAKWWKS